MLIAIPKPVNEERRTERIGFTLSCMFNEHEKLHQRPKCSSLKTRTQEKKPERETNGAGAGIRERNQFCLLEYKIYEQTGSRWQTGRRHKPICSSCSLPPSCIIRYFKYNSWKKKKECCTNLKKKMEGRERVRE